MVVYQIKMRKDLNKNIGIEFDTLDILERLKAEVIHFKEVKGTTEISLVKLYNKLYLFVHSERRVPDKLKLYWSCW